MNRLAVVIAIAGLVIPDCGSPPCETALLPLPTAQGCIDGIEEFASEAVYCRVIDRVVRTP